MTTPTRIQRKRTKGWRMPAGTVYVGRPSMWGNPFTEDLAQEIGYHNAKVAFERWLSGDDELWWRVRSEERRVELLAALPRLRGRDLVCWCPLGQPCHADVLLDLANR